MYLGALLGSNTILELAQSGGEPRHFITASWQAHHFAASKGEVQEVLNRSPNLDSPHDITSNLEIRVMSMPITTTSY